MTSRHGEFSPSKMHRYLPCGGSIYLERKLRAELPAHVADDLFNRSSFYADEGTFAALVGETCLKEGKDVEQLTGLQSRCERFFVGPGHQKGEITTSLLQIYVDKARAEAERLGGDLAVEVRVPNVWKEWATGGTPDARATCAWEGEISIGDLKWGKGVYVEVYDNEQCLGYALPLWLKLGKPKIKVWICQPRYDGAEPVREWEVPQEAMEAFHDRLKAQLELIDSGKAPYVPGEKQCRWCFKSYCPKLQEDRDATLGAIEDTEDSGGVKDWSVEMLAEWMEKVGPLAAAIKDVKGETLRRCMNGTGPETWAVERGDANRVVSATVNQIVRAANKFKLKKADVFDVKLKSPKGLEDLDKEFGAYCRDHDFFETPKGAPKLVPREKLRESREIKGGANPNVELGGWE